MERVSYDYPGRMRPGLIEAKCFAATVAVEPTYPGRMRPGLIEAHVLLCACRLLRRPIRGVCAPASLKHVILRRDIDCNHPIRGVCAPASLKRLDPGPQIGQTPAIRGVCAPASLKLGMCFVGTATCRLSGAYAPRPH